MVAFLTMHLQQRLNVLMKCHRIPARCFVQPQRAPIRLRLGRRHRSAGQHRNDRLFQIRLSGGRPTEGADTARFRFLEAKLVIHRPAISDLAIGIQKQHFSRAFHLQSPGQLSAGIADHRKIEVRRQFFKIRRGILGIGVQQKKPNAFRHKFISQPGETRAIEFGHRTTQASPSQDHRLSRYGLHLTGYVRPLFGNIRKRREECVLNPQKAQQQPYPAPVW